MIATGAALDGNVGDSAGAIDPELRPVLLQIFLGVTVYGGNGDGSASAGVVVLSARINGVGKLIRGSDLLPGV